MNTPKGFRTDHINGRKWDNRRCNLRVCTASQNTMNSGLSKANTTGFKGVTRVSEKQSPVLSKRYFAQIVANGVHHYLGHYSTPEEAHAAYVAAAYRLHGDFANTGVSV